MPLAHRVLRRGRPVPPLERPSLPRRTRGAATTFWPTCLFWLPWCWVCFFMWLINGEFPLGTGPSPYMGVINTIRLALRLKIAHRA